jgi:hypothetical protein
MSARIACAGRMPSATATPSSRKRDGFAFVGFFFAMTSNLSLLRSKAWLA